MKTNAMPVDARRVRKQIKQSTTTMRESNNINSKNLVRGTEPISVAFKVLFVSVILSALIGSIQVEAKTHHSKRQIQASNQATPLTGRENTNWWNLWWQQYIDEAIQPTVRPIIGVTFNGKTINLSDRDGMSINEREQRDVEADTNFTSNTIGGSSGSATMDIERSERMREIGLNLPNSMHPSLAAKQMLAANRKPVPQNMQQNNWQSVKPTIIQPTKMRNLNNRQVSMFQEEPVDNSLGIQMRAAMNQRQEQARPPLRMQQQLDNQMPMEFEQQQQNQMVDYSEENEPDLMDNMNNVGDSGINDSSSSSMMMVDQKITPTPERKNAPKQQTSSRVMETSAPETTRIMMQTTQQVQQASSTLAPKASSNEDSTTTTSRPTSTSRQSTSTRAPPSTTSKVSTNAAEVDVNETPISFERQQETKPTTPSGRVELMNGRPATGMRQQATTTSSRLPTRPSSTTTSGAAQTTDSSVSSTTSSAPTIVTTSSSVTPVNPTMTTTTTTTTAAKDKGDDLSSEVENADEEGEEEESDQANPSLNGNNLMNVGGSNDTSEANEDDESDDDSSEQERPLTTTQSATESESVKQTGAERSSPTAATTATTSTTTQQPLLTTMDIERLPKMSATQSTGEQTSSKARKQDSGKRPSFVMMTLDPERGAIDGETGITVPMDTLMKIMMNQMAIEANQPTTTTSPAATSGRAEEATTTTRPTTSTGGRQNSGRLIESEVIEATTTQGPRLVETSDANSMRQKSKPQPPPPTTKQPMGTTSSLKQTTFAQQQTSSVQATVETSTQKVEMPTSDGSDESKSKLNEPKIELINLDLMPIQRVMSNNSQREERRMMTTLPASKTSASASEMVPAMRDQVVMVEVEPGMRLRPVMSQAGGKGSQNQAANQANTMYMIMMNGGPPPGASSSVEPSAHSKKPPTLMMMANNNNQQATGGAKTATTQMRQQQQQTATTINLPKMLDRITVQPMMRTTQTVPSTKSTTQPAKMSGSPSTSQQQQMTSAAPTSTRKQVQENNIENNMLDKAPKETTTKQQATTTSMLMMMRQQLQQTMSSTSQQPALDLTNTRQQEGGESSIAATTASPQSLSSTASSGADKGTTQTSVSQESSTSTTMSQETSSASTTSKAQQQKQIDSETSSASSTTTLAPSSRRQQVEGSGESGSAANQPSERFKQPASSPAGADGKRPQTKTGKAIGSKTSNMTSSFIPSKLRSDFNKTNKQSLLNKSADSRQQQQEQTTTSSPLVGAGMAQNMAIRQFGGANRMSALANQPVPFGRPTAMTMQSAAKLMQQQQQQPAKVELPSFEYGPSIAVRRPDEPLANGQVPNCTLTGKNFCVLTKDYPMNEVRQAVERSFRSVRIMYEELQTVSDQELHKDDFNATNNQAASGKFACQTQVEMMRPGWAKDEITKEWMLVVNTDVFPQRVRTESCAQPNTPCEFIAPFYDSTCQQRYSLHRMIAIDPHDPSRSPQVAVFKFPAGCVCRVHPIRKSIMQQTSTSTLSPSTIISSSTSKSIRRKR